MLKLTILLGLTLFSFSTSGTSRFVVDTKLSYGMMYDKVDDRMAIVLINGIHLLNRKLPKGRPIIIFLRSGGGFTDSGFAIIETILHVKKSRPIYGIVVDRCNSMCFTILQTTSKRFMNTGATMTEHRSRYVDSKKVAVDSDRRRKSYSKFTVPASWGPQWTVGTKQAIKYNIIDKVVDIRCTKQVYMNNRCPISK